MSDLTNPFDEMEIVTALLVDANERGYITYDQILEALPEIENNLPLLEAVLEEVQSSEIVLYENEEEANEHHVAGAIVTGEEVDDDDDFVVDDDEFDGATHEAPLFDLSNVPIDDSVGLYFREMGQQQLLSAEEEVQLAKEIEAGREAEVAIANGVTSLDELDQLVLIRKPAMRRRPI